MKLLKEIFFILIFVLFIIPIQSVKATDTSNTINISINDNLAEETYTVNKNNENYTIIIKKNSSLLNKCEEENKLKEKKSENKQKEDNNQFSTIELFEILLIVAMLIFLLFFG